MRWTPEEEYLLQLFIGEKDFNEIAALICKKHEAGTPGFPVKRTFHAVRTKISRDTISKDTPPTYDDAWKTVIATAKEFRAKSQKLELGLTSSKERKIISFSDLHIPFFLWEDMKHALEVHKDADVVILNGDILDAYMFSTFSKTKNIAAIKEYRAAFDLVHFLSDHFKKVILVSGNHDYRTTRAIKTSGLSSDVMKVYRPDLLCRIANGEKLNSFGDLEKVFEFKNVLYQKQDSWYVRVGQTIFCHPSGFGSKYPGATVVKLHDHFSQRMDSSDFDSIVVGHTHKVYKGVVSGKLLIEQGAMAHKLPYQFRADLRFKNAMNGYAVIYQDSNGNTNFNDSQPIYLGSHLPTKKGII
jgi:predicted phosphodiesterase